MRSAEKGEGRKRGENKRDSNEWREDVPSRDKRTNEELHGLTIIVWVTARVLVWTKTHGFTDA